MYIYNVHKMGIDPIVTGHKYVYNFRKERRNLFYLMMHSTHFIYGSWASVYNSHAHCSKEGRVLFNDAFNTFYLQLYGVRHMVKDHTNSERRNPLPPHGLLFPISSKGSFICIICIVEHWLEQEIA